MALATLTWIALNAGGRPPIRPQARLAASAVQVRSRRNPQIELSEGGADGEDQPSGRAGGIDVLV
jgi:hypothetical protein